MVKNLAQWREVSYTKIKETVESCQGRIKYFDLMLLLIFLNFTDLHMLGNESIPKKDIIEANKAGKICQPYSLVA